MLASDPASDSLAKCRAARSEGSRAFVPKPLAPTPPFEFPTELRSLLSRSDRARGRLDGPAGTLVARLLEARIIVERTGRRRNRVFAEGAEEAG